MSKFSNYEYRKQPAVRGYVATLRRCVDLTAQIFSVHEGKASLVSIW
jgi:hypothetical protein